MKIMFTSSGLVTDELVDKAIELCDKPSEEISVAIINEASKVESGDKRWVIRHLNDLDTNFGGEIEIVDLQALNIEEIMSKLDNCDIIYVLGGDSDYLMHIYEISGLSSQLPKLLENKVYIGCSAGAMVLARKTDDEFYDQLFAERRRVNIKQYMNLIDHIVIPHKDDEKFPNVTKESIDAFFDLDNIKFFATAREQAVILNENTFETVGGKVYGL